MEHQEILNLTIKKLEELVEMVNQVNVMSSSIMRILLLVGKFLELLFIFAISINFIRGKLMF